MRKKTILILYYTRWVYPLRDTIEKHLYSWRRYSRHRIIYVNVMFGFPEKLLKKINIDVVIFHTIFLGMRWTPSIFTAHTEKCAYLKKLSCVKIAMPQDEFMQTELLNDFINDFGITHILTCASEPDWSKIYDKIDRQKVCLKTILTGYLDPRTVKYIERQKTKVKVKDIDIGYRAWKAEYWLGEHGMHKVKIANLFKKLSKEHGLITDVSMREEDVLAGNKWFKYLLRCKATIGVEGGASVLDKDGSIKVKVDKYLKEQPAATFEETRSRCFPDDDHKLELACISPRHLESCVTETCQLLIEGKYNNILQPWKHYVPIKKDYSNANEALDLIKDNGRINRITKTAYKDIVQSGKWTYPRFIKGIESTIINDASFAGNSKTSPWRNTFFVAILLNLKDFLDWQFIRLELEGNLFRNYNWIKQLFFKKAKKIIIKLYGLLAQLQIWEEFRTEKKIFSKDSNAFSRSTRKIYSPDVIDIKQSGKLSDPKRVLVFSHMFPNQYQKNFGCFVAEQVKALRQYQGWDVRVVSCQPYWINTMHPLRIARSISDYYRQLKIKWFSYDDIPTIFIPYLVGGIFRFRLSAFTYCFSAAIAASRIRKNFNFDLVHAHTAYLDGLAGRYVARRYNVPLVITEHTGPFSYFTGKEIVRQIALYSLRSANKIICVSRALKEEVKKWLPLNAQRNLISLPNGVDTNLFNLNGHPAAQQQPYRILSVISLDDNKNPFCLLEAFQYLCRWKMNVELTIVGGGVLWREIENWVVSNNLSHLIHLAGWQSREQVSLLMRQICDVLVLPSRTETFGVVVIEAMASGKPVVSTRCGGPESILTEAHLGELCENNNPLALAQSIKKVLDNPEQYPPQKIREFALEKYSFQQVASQLASIYEKVSHDFNKPEG